MTELPKSTQSKALADVAQDLRTGESAALRLLFEAYDSPPPAFTWSPQPVDLQNPLVIRFAQTCRALSGPDAFIPLASFDLDRFGGLKDWMTVLEPGETPDDTRYTHYGEAISAIRGLSKKGTNATEYADFVSIFFQAVYQAVQQRREPLLTVHVPPRQVFAGKWESLALPVVGPSGTVEQIVNISVPDNELRPGLEIIPDPVLILDSDEIVRYANRAAREMFGQQIYQGRNMDLFTFSGIHLTLPSSPEDLAKSRAVHDVISIALAGTMIERFLLTISGTIQWDKAFYVITLRPAPDQNGSAASP